MVLPIHLESVLGLVFCLVNKNSLNSSGLVLPGFFCFVVCRSFSFYIFSDSKAEKAQFSE